MVTLQQRLDTARSLHDNGYNCAQSVALAFADESSLPSGPLAAATAALGGGVGGTGHLCGCVSGMAVVAGMKAWADPADKAAAYRLTAPMVRAFEQACGSLECRELKRARKSCPWLIEQAVTILHNTLEADGK